MANSMVEDIAAIFRQREEEEEVSRHRRIQQTEERTRRCKMEER